MSADLVQLVVIHMVGIVAVFLVAILLTISVVGIAHRIAAAVALRRWRRRPPAVPEVGPCTLTTLSECRPDAVSRPPVHRPGP